MVIPVLKYWVLEEKALGDEVAQAMCPTMTSRLRTLRVVEIFVQTITIRYIEIIIN